MPSELRGKSARNNGPAVLERVVATLCAVGAYWLFRWTMHDAGSAAVAAVVLWTGPWWWRA